MTARRPTATLRILAAAVLVALVALPEASGLAFHAVATYGAAGTSVTLNQPASTAAGDLLLAAVSVRGGTGTTITAPGGWTLLSRTDAGTDLSLALYQRAAAAGAATHTFTLGTSIEASAALAIYRGLDSATPINAQGTAGTAADKNLAAPSVTTTRANTILVAFFAQARATGLTPAASLTSRANDVQAGNGNNAVVLEVAEKTQAAAGATGTLTATSIRAETWIAQQVALAAPSVAFSQATSSGAESSTPASLTVSLSASTNVATTVNYAVTGGTATGGGTDFTLLGTGTLTIAAGATSGTVDLSIVDESLGELSETVQVTLSAPSNAVLGTQTTHTYTILDDDPRISVASDPVDAAGLGQTGAAWGGWTATPGATNTPGLNYLKITNIGTISTQGVTIDFTPDVFTGTTTASETIPLDGNIRFASFEDTSPGTSAPNEGTYTFGSVSASGSLTLSFTGTNNILYVLYRIDTTPSLLADQPYQAAYTVTAV